MKGEKKKKEQFTSGKWPQLSSLQNLTVCHPGQKNNLNVQEKI